MTYVTTVVATVLVTVEVATVVVDVAVGAVAVEAGTGNLDVQKRCASGISATAEATAPITPPHAAAEPLLANEKINQKVT
jgi:H+/gluconate symporter-like permease